MFVEAFPAAPSPEDAARALCTRPGVVFLDGDGTATGRFSFVGSDPVERIAVPFGTNEPLAALDGLDRPIEADGPLGPRAREVPRWIGFVAYDAVWSGRPSRHARDPRVPVLAFARYDALLAYDHVSGATVLVGDDAEACARLRARLAQTPCPDLRARVGTPRVGPPEVHVATIERALEHVAAGDIYQVNLARRWTAPFEGDPLALFLSMRRASPVPLGAYLADASYALASRSMECFLRWDRPAGRLESRPIKGTIARAGALEEETRTLRGDDKERAEHTMIVDLMRNDLGRVAAIGSVRVETLFAVEPFANLAHLVSTVACTPRPDVDARAVLEATFPPGSITGTPKLRAIEVIDALEQTPREVYTGAIGFLDRAGGLSLSVAIRTALVVGDEVRYHAGGGIVWGSRPDREVAETELKARVFLEAVEGLAEGAARAGDS